MFENFTPSLSCPNCRQELQDSPELYGQDVQCPSCMTTFSYGPSPYHSFTDRPSRRVVHSTPLDGRLVVALICGSLSAASGVLGLLTAGLFGAGWWCLVVSSFAIAGLVITFTTPWKPQSKIVVWLSSGGLLAAVLLLLSLWAFQKNLEHQFDDMEKSLQNTVAVP